MSRRRWVALCLCLVLTLTLPLTAAAQSAAPGGGTVVASGLNNPRGIAIGSDGTIYVAESGTGGAEQFTAPPPFGPSNRGMSAQIVKIAPNGTKSPVVGSLPSLVLGHDPIGAKGITISGNDLWFTIGHNYADTPAAYHSSVARVPLTGGSSGPRVADIGAYEKANNPDGLIVESNTYGVAAGAGGMLWVADAGGNTIYRVNTADGQVSRVAVLGPLASPMPNPGRAGRMERDPVPTGITVGPNGDAYVSLLGGFPFIPGAKVVRVTAAGQVSDVAGGLAATVDIEMGPDGKLYVVEFGSFSLTTQPPGWVPNSGRVVRVGMDGSKEVIVSGLNTPNGIAFDAQGRLYVVDASLHAVTAASGRVLRYDMAQLTPMPYPAPAAAPAPAAPAAPATPAPSAPPAQMPRAAGTAMPTQLPRTGDLAPTIPALAGLGALFVGWRLRRRS